MPRKRRLAVSINESKNIKTELRQYHVKSIARDRLKGALQEVLDNFVNNETSSPVEQMSLKRERDLRDERKALKAKRDLKSQLNIYDKEVINKAERKAKPSRELSPPRQSYVMKLFDRSVDLAQFTEKSPLYPICRAWIINQPKSIYACSTTVKEEFGNDRSVDSGLPGPEGPLVSRVPPLLPCQEARSKHNINLNYREFTLPSPGGLLRTHAVRWQAVREQWQQQGALREARYASTQVALTQININSAHPE